MGRRGRGRRLGSQLDPDDVDCGNDVRVFSARSDVVCSTEAVRAMRCDQTCAPKVEQASGRRSRRWGELQRVAVLDSHGTARVISFVQVVPTPRDWKKNKYLPSRWNQWFWRPLCYLSGKVAEDRSRPTGSTIPSNPQGPYHPAPNTEFVAQTPTVGCNSSQKQMKVRRVRENTS